jgi:hypothetical protein
MVEEFPSRAQRNLVKELVKAHGEDPSYPFEYNVCDPGAVIYRGHQTWDTIPADFDVLRRSGLIRMHSSSSTGAQFSLSPRAIHAAALNFGLSGADEVLEVVYEQWHRVPGQSIPSAFVQAQLGYDPLFALKELKGQGHIALDGHIATLTPAGANAFRECARRCARIILNQPMSETAAIPQHLTQNFNSVELNAPLSGNLQVGTWNSSQSAIVTVNREVEAQLAQLREVVSKSDLAPMDRDDALHELHRVEELAKHKPTTDVAKRINERLDLLQRMLNVSQKLARIAGPLILALTKYFSNPH